MKKMKKNEFLKKDTLSLYFYHSGNCRTITTNVA